MNMQNTPTALNAAAISTRVSSLALPDNFPVQISGQQERHLLGQIAQTDIGVLGLMEISRIGFEVEEGLHKTLDRFLERIEAYKNPIIFQLIPKLSQSIESANLPALADDVLNPKPNTWSRVVGLFNKKAVSESLSKASEEIRLLVSSRSKQLADVVADLERKLKEEQARLESEIKSQEALKNAYQERFDEFCQLCAFLYGFLAKSKQELAELEKDPLVNEGKLQDHKDKLLALESRTLAVEAVLTRLPSDQLVIRQVQNSGIATLQETTTSASARFASIKMTLLTIHSALAVRDLQRLGQQGADLDRNLLAVRGTLMKQVVQEAVSAPGRNRLEQANQIRAIVDQSKELHELYLQAQTTTLSKFEEARQILSGARAVLATAGKSIQPNKPLAI